MRSSRFARSLVCFCWFRTCESNEREPINVIYQTAEDGLGDTIKPRLLAANADCSRVHVIDDKDTEPLTFMDKRLEEAIIKTKARLVILDPIQGFLGMKIDMNKANGCAL